MKSSDVQKRLYAFRMLEYLLLDEMIITLFDVSCKFNHVYLKPFSNAQFNGGVLKQNQDYKVFLILGASNLITPIKVEIKGEKDSVYTCHPSEILYIRPSTQKGKQIVKGKATFIINGKPETFPFEDEYVVK